MDVLILPGPVARARELSLLAKFALMALLDGAVQEGPYLVARKSQAGLGEFLDRNGSTVRVAIAELVRAGLVVPKGRHDGTGGALYLSLNQLGHTIPTPAPDPIPARTPVEKPAVSPPENQRRDRQKISGGTARKSAEGPPENQRSGVQAPIEDRVPAPPELNSIPIQIQIQGTELIRDRPPGFSSGESGEPFIPPALEVPEARPAPESPEVLALIEWATAAITRCTGDGIFAQDHGATLVRELLASGHGEGTIREAMAKATAQSRKALTWMSYFRGCVRGIADDRRATAQRDPGVMAQVQAQTKVRQEAYERDSAARAQARETAANLKALREAAAVRWGEMRPEDRDGIMAQVRAQYPDLGDTNPALLKSLCLAEIEPRLKT